jgi:hypothetical protein
VRRLITRLIAPLVIDYFDYAARPGASARRMARRRLLHLHHASGCLRMSRGSSCGSSSTTSPRAGSYAARPGASARHAAHRVPRSRQLRLHHASGCLDTSRDSSRGSLSTTSTTPCVWVPRHVTRLVADFFTYTVRPGASACCAARRRPLCLTQARTPRVQVARHVARLVMWLVVDYFAYAATSSCGHTGSSHAVRRNYLPRGNTGSTSSTSRAAETSSSDRIASTTHLD